MTDTSLTDLLERSAGRRAVSPPPLDTMLSNVRRTRRRRAGGLTVVAAVGVGAVVLGTSVLTGSDGTRHPDVNVPLATTTASSSSLPDSVHVTCSRRGIQVDSTSIQTRRNGIVLVVTSTLPEGPYLTYSSSGKDSNNGGDQLAVGTETKTMDLPPGVLTLGCEDAGDLIGGREVRLRVSDPGGYWRGFDALESVGCTANSGLNDWKGDFFQTAGSARAAVEAVAAAFSQFEADNGRPGTFTVRETATGYVGDPSQIWITDKDGTPHATIEVQPYDEVFHAAAVAPCH